MTTTAQLTQAQAPPASGWVKPLVWTAITLDGFDTVVLGAAMPALLADPALGLTTQSATAIATIGLVGMTIGALSMGRFTDRFGRRTLMIGAVIVFSVFTLAAAFATSAGWLFVTRFLAGLGLGGALPTGIAMVTEFSQGSRAASATTAMMTGHHVGAVLTAGTALLLMEQHGWQSLFIAGALPALVLVPLMIARLPESPDWLTARERDLAGGAGEPAGPAAEGAGTRPGLVALLAPGYLRNTVAIWVTSFMGLLLVYGLNTWTPQIMRESGYQLGTALQLLLVLNAGAIAGMLLGGRVADRLSPRVGAIAWFAGASVSLALLSFRLPMAALMVLVFITGAFVFTSQAIVYGFTASNHPPHLRGTALGMSAGLGRTGAICGPVLGGALIATGHAHPWGFIAFAGVAAIGVVSMSLTRNRTA